MADFFVPLHTNVLIKCAEVSEGLSKGGLIIPDNAREKPLEGVVIAVGRGRTGKHGKIFPLVLKPNDRVMFGEYAGNKVQIEEEEFLIMDEDEVLGVLGGIPLAVD